MKLTFLGAAIAAAIMAFSAPASALTLGQARAEMGCPHSVCLNTVGVDVTDSGVTHPRIFPDAQIGMPSNGSYQHKYSWAGDLVWNQQRHGSASWSQTYEVKVCVKKRLIFHPNSSRALSWSVKTSVSPGSCKVKKPR